MLVHDGERGPVGGLRGRIRAQRPDIGIGDALLLGGIEARIGHGIGIAGTRARKGFIARRIDRIGGDVVDPGQAIGFQPEICRISEEQERDRHRRQGGAHSGQPLHPDHGKGGHCDEERNHRDRERAAKGRDAGLISRTPERTTMMARKVATNAKPAMRRAHSASFDIGSEWK